MTRRENALQVHNLLEIGKDDLSSSTFFYNEMEYSEKDSFGF